MCKVLRQIVVPWLYLHSLNQRPDFKEVHFESGNKMHVLASDRFKIEKTHRDKRNFMRTLASARH